MIRSLLYAQLWLKLLLKLVVFVHTSAGIVLSSCSLPGSSPGGLHRNHSDFTVARGTTTLLNLVSYDGKLILSTPHVTYRSALLAITTNQRLLLFNLVELLLDLNLLLVVFST